MTALVSAELLNLMGFPGGQTVKNPPAVQETQETASILGWGGSLGEGNGNPLSNLAWEIPQTEEPGRL